MIRHRYPEIKRRFSENQERLLLYGPPYTGKSFLLQSLTKEEGVKNYILCDLHIDRDFTDGLLKAISEGESLCHFAAGFFFKPEALFKASNAIPPVKAPSPITATTLPFFLFISFIEL